MKKNCIGPQSDPPLKPDPSTLNLKPDPSLPKSKPDAERPDSLLAKQKSSTPLIVCRKRSSISCKLSSSNKAEDKPVIKPKPAVKSSSSSEGESSIKLKLKEKPVTSAWSMRSGSGRINTTITSTNKGEASKTEKEKTEVLKMAKKRGAADFLKRIKKNSPAKGMPLLETLKSSPGNGSESSRREPRYRQKKRVDERKGVAARQKGGGGSDGAGWKLVKEKNSPSKRGVGRPVKRGREGGEAEVAAKKPKKRTRR